MNLQQQGGDIDEKDLEALDEVALVSFKAEPSMIRPFSQSKVSWKVTAPKAVVIRLNGTAVPDSSERLVAPTFTTAYMLSAKAGRASKFLGTVAVQVDYASCFSRETPDIPTDLAAAIQKRIDADTSGVYFRNVPVKTPKGTIYVPSTPSVWITPDRLHIFLQLGWSVNNFPDPDIDISVSFELKVVENHVPLGDTGLASINEDISVDVSFPFYVWNPVTAIGLAFATDDARQKARASANEMITAIVIGLNTYFVLAWRPPGMQVHNVQLRADSDGQGIFALTFCPVAGPIVAL